jgi:hypothetical protein
MIPGTFFDAVRKALEGKIDVNQLTFQYFDETSHATFLRAEIDWSNHTVKGHYLCSLDVHSYNIQPAVDSILAAWERGTFPRG